MKVVILVGVLLPGVTSSACGVCSPGGPSAQPITFSGTIRGSGLVFHDIAVPPDTDSITVGVQWSPTDAEVRLIQIDPNCNPTQTASCDPRTDPQGPAPNSSQTIVGYLSHQGANATGRVRFVLQNLTADVAATYTAIATPQRHGCER